MARWKSTTVPGWQRRQLPRRGTWFAIVDLQPRYQFEVHDLQAKVTAGGTETLSDVARVTYDANYIDLAPSP